MKIRLTGDDTILKLTNKFCTEDIELLMPQPSLGEPILSFYPNNALFTAEFGSKQTNYGLGTLNNNQYSYKRTSQTIYSGIFINKDVYLNHEPNLISENIKNNVTIFNVTGTYKIDDKIDLHFDQAFEAELLAGNVKYYKNEFLKDEILNDCIFKGNKQLSTIELPNFTGIIPASCFENCTGLKTINIPNITEISDYAFRQCTTFSSAITFSKCKKIGHQAFMSCYKLPGINLQECEIIESGAFYNCSSLSSIHIPVCTDLGSTVFCNCSKLEYIDAPKCVNIGGEAFKYCYELSGASLPICSRISYEAFYNCSSLKNIFAPMCEFIDVYTFANCTSLEEVDFPLCSSIYSNAFMNNSSLSSINFPICSDISRYAFVNCSSLREVNFPQCIRIGDYAFQGCTNLTSISFPMCQTVYSGAFFSCSSITLVYLPECNILYSSVFHHCAGLTSVDLPKCGDIYNEAFFGCSNLTSVSLPQCAYIGNDVFNETKITELFLPDLTITASYCFYSVPYLRKVDIGVSYQQEYRGQLTLGEEAFTMCSKLEMLILRYPYIVALLGSYGFSAAIPRIYVPNELVDTYKGYTNWNLFSDYIHGFNAETGRINFTINADVMDEFNADIGMTWGEWIESEYNTRGYIIFNNELTLYDENNNKWYISKAGLITSDIEPENISDIYIKNINYEAATVAE